MGCVVNTNVLTPALRGRAGHVYSLIMRYGPLAARLSSTCVEP